MGVFEEQLGSGGQTPSARREGRGCDVSEHGDQLVRPGKGLGTPSPRKLGNQWEMWGSSVS